jgi:hypothetical protein
MMQTRLTAIVHTADVALVIGSAQCPEHLAAQIAAYVRQRCDHALQPKVESPTAGTTGPGNARLERLSPSAA